MIKNNLLNIGVNISICDDENLSSECSFINLNNGIEIQRTIKNNTEKIVKLKHLKSIITNINFGAERIKDYYYANENPRIFCTMTVPVDYNRLDDNDENNKKFNLPVNRKWNDPGVQQGRICSSPYQPFPAILLSNYESKSGIVVGSLSQDIFYHSFEVGHDKSGAYIEIYSSFKDIEYREIKPNEELTDIIYIGETDKADDINHIFDGYVYELNKVLGDNVAKCDTNRHTLVWDSWNDGIYRDVNEEMLINEAKAVKKHFPNVEYFQLDDGYSSYCEKNVDLDAHGMGVVYEGEDGIDKKKFPSGLKHYTDEIKKTGLKPAVWIGGLCPVKTKIYKERKDWFIDYFERIPYSQPLDVSKKEVRDYILSVWDTFINKYGFQGVKLDFWSYAFEDRHDLLEYKDKSGYEYRKWMLENMRKVVSDSGYIQVCCDLSMGNPFLGKYINNFRLGIDIGAGKFSNITTTMFWATAILSPHTGNLYVPNSDSIGLLPGLNDMDFMFAVNFQIITRTLVEISGRFSIVEENNPRLKVLKRATKYLNNGENVYFANYDYRKKGENVPEIVYINSAFDCDSSDYVTVALFNSSDKEKTITVNMSDIGLKKANHQVEYVWEEKFIDTDKISETLLPHGSKLLKIRR